MFRLSKLKSHRTSTDNKQSHVSTDLNTESNTDDVCRFGWMCLTQYSFESKICGRVKTNKKKYSVKMTV